MKGLSFKKMNVVYGLETEYRKHKSEDYVSTYSCLWEVKGTYEEASNSYEFCLERKDVKINGKKVEKLMDRIVYEIGSSLYPIRLKVSAQLGVSQILNYDEVVERWKAVTEKCRQEHPGEVLERYIRYSRDSISTPRSLLLSLFNDSFINLYFRNLYIVPEDKNIRERVEILNFPLQEIKSCYFCTIEAPEAETRKLEGALMVIVPGQEGHAEIDFKYHPKGVPDTVAGVFSAIHNGKEYRKTIKIALQRKKES